MSDVFYVEVVCRVNDEAGEGEKLLGWLSENDAIEDERSGFWFNWGRHDIDLLPQRDMYFRSRDSRLMRQFALWAEFSGIPCELYTINNSSRLDVTPDPNPEPRIVCVHASGNMQHMIVEWCSRNFPDLCRVKLREITGTLSPLVTLEFYNKYSKQEFVDNWFDVLELHYSEQRAFEHLVQPAQWQTHTIVDRRPRSS